MRRLLVMAAFRFGPLAAGTVPGFAGDVTVTACGPWWLQYFLDYDSDASARVGNGFGFTYDLATAPIAEFASVRVPDDRSLMVDPGNHARRDRWFAFANYCAPADESAKAI
jgi:hypothetical protein